MDEREWLARQFEERFAPKNVNAELATRARDHFEALVVEYGAKDAVSAAWGREGDTTLLVHHALEAAIERAARETAAALRRSEI